MKKENNKDWDRINLVLEHSGERSISALAKKLGLKRAENLYQIKRGNNGVSMELARRINNLYPNFSISWLTCGEDNVPTGGTMAQNLYTKEDVIVKIPLYGSIMSSNGITNSQPERFLFLSSGISQGASIAMVYNDNALTPRLMSGSYALLREVHGEILYGNIYLVETADFRLFRIVRKTRNSKQIRLTTLQPENYDDIIIDKKNITSMFLVCGAITNLYS